MSYEITRKQFLRLSVGFGAALTAGCSGDDDEGTDTAAGSSTGHNHESGSHESGMHDTASPDTGMPQDTGVDAGMTETGMPQDTGMTEAGMTETGVDTGMTETGMDSSSGSGSSTGAGIDCSDDPIVVIANPHMHSFSIPAAHVAAGTPETYDIMGGAQHTHSVTLTAADFTTLTETGEVVVTTAGGGHSHMVTVTCG